MLKRAFIILIAFGYYAYTWWISLVRAHKSNSEVWKKYLEKYKS